jgi:Peptidase family C25
MWPLNQTGSKPSVQISRRVPGWQSKGTTNKFREQSHHCALAAGGFAVLCRLLGILWFLLPCSPAALAVDPSPLLERRAVQFGPPIDLSDVDVQRQTTPRRGSAVATKTNVLSFRIDAEQCAIYPTPPGYDYLMAGDLLAEGEPGYPLLPAKTYFVELPKEAEVFGLEVTEGQFREVTTELNLLPARQEGGPNWTKEVQDPEVYRRAKPVPGRLVSYDRGADNQRQYVFARLFPVQYVPAKKKAIVLTQATIHLYYGLKDPGAGSTPGLGAQHPAQTGLGGLKTEAQCVVICPASLRLEGESLSQFHASAEGITSAVVTTEAIRAAYRAASDPPFDGYQDPRLQGERVIHRYDYDLAKRIVAYLRDQPTHPNLIYVALLGDALLVPPSFYYHSALEQALNKHLGKASRTHAQWIPTDFFYASPDYDLAPNYAIGRIPVNDAAEARQVVEKIVRWRRQADWSWFRNVHIFGYAFPKAEADGLWSGMNVTRSLEADDRMEKVYIEAALATRDFGFLWGTTHASVGGLAGHSSVVSADDLMRYPPHSRVPVVVSISCSSGAFDLDLMDAPGSGATRSFGEAVLKSPAAGIAYFGSSRLAGGTASYYLSGTNRAVIRERTFAELFYGLLQSYDHGTDTLGKLYSDALFGFVSKNDLAGNLYNELTIFKLVLLGDPALKIPQHP